MDRRAFWRPTSVPVLAVLALLLAKWSHQGIMVSAADEAPVQLAFQTDPKCKCDGCSKYEVGPDEQYSIIVPNSGGVSFYVKGDEKFLRGDDIYQVTVRNKKKGVVLVERSASCYSSSYQGDDADDYTVTLTCLNQIFKCKLTAGAAGTPAPIPSPLPSPLPSPRPSPSPKPSPSPARNLTIEAFDDSNSTNSSLGSAPAPQLTITYTPLNITRPWLNAAQPLSSGGAAALQLLSAVAALLAVALPL